MFHTRSRRVSALPTIGYQFGVQQSKGLNALEVSAFVLFSLLVLVIGK